MFVRKESGPVEVSLPNGDRLNRSDLPPKKTKRWVARLKKVVVDAVEHGLISKEEAMSLYDLSSEELESWVDLSKNHGGAALRATALQKYRQL